MFHKRLLAEFKDNKSMVWGMVATQWITLLANVVLMIFVSELIADIFSGTLLQKSMIKVAVILIAAVFVRAMMNLQNQNLSVKVSDQLKERLRTLIYEKLMRMGSKYRDTMKTSEIVQISTEGVEQLEIYFGKYVPQFFYSMLAPVTLFILVGAMSMKVAVVLLICVPLIPVSIIAVQKFAKKMLAKYWSTYTELGDSFLECLQGLTTLKIYQADRRYADKMDEESEKFRKVTMRVLMMQLNSISIMDLVAYGGAALGIILSILELQKGNISLAQCFFIMMISAEFFLPLRLLGSFFHIAMNGNAAADKIFKLLDEPETGPGRVKDEKELKSNVISFEKVSFFYTDNEEKQVLNQVNFVIQKGLTALVGESGCGKSTAVSLIMGECSVTKGQIRLGDIPIEELDSKLIYKKITRISHDSYLFAGTIKENLRMGKADATEEEMYEALRQVNMDTFVLENGGLSMKLQEKAANISGGQKQRLSIARALLHNSDIYIFDEATSNVDVESENDIMSVVKALSKEKTVLLISHRLANVVDANMIYVLKDGRIIESGTHEVLKEKKAYYSTLYTKQQQLERYGKEGPDEPKE